VNRLDDPHRLASLEALGALPPGPDDPFDRLSRMVASVVDAPVALISLVGDQRQQFVGAHGLASPWSETRQTPLSHSFCQHVVTSGAPLIVTDAHRDERVAGNRAIAELGVTAYLGVPLVTGDGQTLGSLCAISGTERAWDAAELDKMRVLAEIVVRELELRRTNAALDKARAAAAGAADRQRSNVELLLAIARIANQSDVPAEALRGAVELICRHAGWPLGHLLLANDGKLVPTGLWHCEEPGRFRVFQSATEAMTFSGATTLVGRVLETRAPVWITDLSANRMFKRGSAALYAGLNTGFVAPIVVGDEVVAAIELYTPEDASAVMDRMVVVPEAAMLLGRVIERDRARQAREHHAAELERRSHVDEMTSLLNRRGFFAVAEQHLLMARRKRQSALAFFLDLEGLKAVNDTHGHAAGDALIASAAAMLRATFRDSDIIGRLGGDEFVVLAPEARVEDVEAILARLHGEAHRINQTRPHALAWSVGIAEFSPGRPEPLDELIKRADAMMYEHKRRRRKRRSSLDEQRAAG
jgi:diguanylate cyclase (GGDEF)-like protein